MRHYACVHTYIYIWIYVQMYVYYVQVYFFYTWQIIIFDNISFKFNHPYLFTSYYCTVTSLLVASGYKSFHWLYLVSRMLFYHTTIWCFKSTELGNTDDSEQAGKSNSPGFNSNVRGINVLWVIWVPILFALFWNIMAPNQPWAC